MTHDYIDMEILTYEQRIFI